MVRHREGLGDVAEVVDVGLELAEAVRVDAADAEELLGQRRGRGLDEAVEPLGAEARGRVRVLGRRGRRERVAAEVRARDGLARRQGPQPEPVGVQHVADALPLAHVRQAAARVDVDRGRVRDRRRLEERLEMAERAHEVLADDRRVVARRRVRVVVSRPDRGAAVVGRRLVLERVAAQARRRHAAQRGPHGREGALEGERRRLRREVVERAVHGDAVQRRRLRAAPPRVRRLGRRGDRAPRERRHAREALVLGKGRVAPAARVGLDVAAPEREGPVRDREPLARRALGQPRELQRDERAPRVGPAVREERRVARQAVRLHVRISETAADHR